MNNYTLRPYQEGAVQTGVDFFLKDKSKKNKFIVAPTGAGKSLIISNIALRLDAPTLCLAPSKELLTQNYKKFISYGFEASIFSASVGIKEIGNVTFATIGSIYKNPELFKDFRYALIDECHKTNPKDEGMYTSFFNELNIKILGLTATPFRLKSYMFPEPHSKLNFLNRMRPKLFHDCIHVTQIQEMTKNKWWSPLNYISEPFNPSKLKINSTGANYTEQSVKAAIKANNTPDQAIYWAKKLRGEGRKQIVIFMPTVDEAEYIAKKLGVDCISSRTKPKDREKVLEDFESGKNWAIANCNVLSIGYDNQAIDGMVDGSPTLSLAMYYQKLGRGVRIDMSPNPTKTDCTIVDLVGNFDLFGRIEDLEIKQINGKWCVVSGSKMLTNVPITRDNPIPELEDEIMGFGKFKGNKFKDVPKWYWKYIKENFNREARNETLFRYIDSLYL